MDNRYEKEAGSGVKLSSDIIVNKFGGIESLASALRCDLKTGIEGSRSDLDERARVYGVNSFPPPKIKSILELIMENFDDFIN
jgi:Ca2+-transporting ATPase